MSRREQQRLKRAERERAESIAYVMGDVRGRRFVASLLEAANHGKVMFHGNSRDAFLLGAQALAGGLVAELKTRDLAAFHRMEVEAANAKQSLAEDKALDEQQPE